MDYDTTFLIILWIFRIACVSFLIISWKNLKWGVFLICAFLPAYLIRFKALPAFAGTGSNIPMTALELMILILFGVWIIKNIGGSIVPDRYRGCGAELQPGSTALWGLWSHHIKKNKLLIISIGLFLLSATISMFISPDLRVAAGIWKAYFIEPILFLIVFLSVIKTKKDLRFVFYALGFSALYISLYAIGQKLFGLQIPIPWQGELRATSIFPFPNAVGLFLAPMIPLFLYQLITLREPEGSSEPRMANYKLPITRKIFYFLTIILSITAIYFAKSEGALVTLVVVAIIWGLLQSKISRRITICIILLGFISCIVFSNTLIFSEIKTKLLLQDWSGKVRLTIWAETWEMLKDKPFFGAGLSGYQTAIIPYHKSTNWMEIFLYPHNIFLNLWAELGLLGLLSFITIIVWFFMAVKKLPITNYKLPIMMAMTVLLIHGLVDVPYFKNDLSILFWMLIGLAILSKNTKKELTN